MENVVFLGAGTAFYEIFELIEDINRQAPRYKIIAILDDDEKAHGKIMNGVKVEGPLSFIHNYENAKFIFGIGSLRTRKEREKIIERLGITLDRFVTLIHPGAKIYSSAKIGNGCIIHYGCVIGAFAEISDFVIMTFHAIVGNYTKIESYSMITTSVTILNNVKIGKHAFIGTGSVVNDNVTIDDYGVVGMGSMVAINVKANHFVLGNPARILGIADNWM